VRFKALLQIGELDGCSVLDIGCGIGDFAVYLESCGINVDFTGYDIVPEAIKLAQRKCPAAVFEARNILLAPPTQRFDYIVSSGIFAFGDQPFFEGIVERAVSLAQVAYGFNLYQTSQSSFFSPTIEYVLDFCTSLGIDRTEVVADYLHDDYTFFAYR
jgi:SAM-dependent methyltransferase